MGLNQRPCGNPDCHVSTSIDEMTLTFGSGELDDWGFWEKPCFVCATAHKRACPEDRVWPTKLKKYRINVYRLVEPSEPDIYDSLEEIEKEIYIRQPLLPENRYEIEEVEECAVYQELRQGKLNVEKI